MKKNKMINWLTSENFGWRKNYDEVIDRDGLFWFVVQNSFELGTLFAAIYALELESYLPKIGFDVPCGFRFDKSDFRGRDIDLTDAYPTMQTNLAIYLGIAVEMNDEEGRPCYMYSFCNHEKVINALKEHAFSGCKQYESEEYELPLDYRQHGQIIMQRAMARYS